MSQNLLSPFLENVARHPQQTAIVDKTGTTTYAQLAQRSAALAVHLQRKGVQKNDRVLLARAVDAELFVTLPALWRIGAVVVFPEPALGLKGLTHAVNIAAPQVFLSAGKYRYLSLVSCSLRSIPKRLTPKMRYTAEPHWQDAQVTTDDLAVISFISGSTGAPKAIARSHGFMLSQSECLAPLLADADEDDIDLVAFPMFVVANLAMGLTSVLPDWKTSAPDAVSAEHLKGLIQRHKVTRVLIPPVLCETLSRIQHPPKLKAIFTGGGPVYPDLLVKLAAHYPVAELVCVYGSTEAEPIAHFHASHDAPAITERMTSGAGLYAEQPVPEISIQIENDEILVTGNHVNKGYINAEYDVDNKLVRNGCIWHRTGDAGRLDADGLWLLGRHSAKAAGVYPFQIEVAARCWPGVKHAALTGNNVATLALCGQENESGDWQSRAAKLGSFKVVTLGAIPMDKRHRSKVDYNALNAVLLAKSR